MSSEKKTEFITKECSFKFNKKAQERIGCRFRASIADSHQGESRLRLLIAIGHSHILMSCISKELKMYAKKQMGTLDVRIDPDLKTAILTKGQRGELGMRVHLAKKKNEVSKDLGDWPYYTLITQVKTPEEKFEEFLLKNRLKNLTPTKRR